MRVSKLLKETKVLFLVGFADLVITLGLFYFSGCSVLVEANKFMRLILSKGPVVFIFVKIGSMLVFLSIIEFIRHRGWVAERRVKAYLKIGIVAYVGLWIFSVIKANVVPLF